MKIAWQYCETKEKKNKNVLRVDGLTDGDDVTHKIISYIKSPEERDNIWGYFRGRAKYVVRICWKWNTFLKVILIFWYFSIFQTGIEITFLIILKKTIQANIP